MNNQDFKNSLMDEIDSIDETCEGKQYENFTCSTYSSQEGKNMHMLNAAKGSQCLYQSDRTTVFISAIKEKACCTSVREEL